MKLNLALYKQYAPSEIIHMIFERAITKKRGRLYELQDLLEDMDEQNYRVRRIGESNLLTILNDVELKPFQLLVRRNTSDILIFRQIVVKNEYKSLVDEISKRGENIRYIIDAGANIGCSTVYFKKKFPDSTIISIEPEQKNHACLLKNIEINDLQNIVSLRAALWINQDDLEISRDFRDHREWSYSVEPASQRKDLVKGVTVEDLMVRYSLPRIDILKIDIEGAERLIFESEERVKSFLPRVKYLVMEIHEEFGVKDKILALLERFHFSYFFSGELTVACNEKFAAAVR